MVSQKVVVVGGGIAGLTAAAFVAKAGREVVLLERSEHLGGRGASTVHNGFHVNIGPHAVYKDWALDNALRDLGLPLSGGRPKVDGGRAVVQGQTHAFPAGAATILTTGLFSLAEKLEAGAFFAGLGRLDLTELEGVSIGDWVDNRFKHQRVRDYFLALARVTTYANAPQATPAALVLGILKAGAQVVYPDGGWNQIVDGLQGILDENGSAVCTGVRVEKIDSEGGSHRLYLADGAVEEAAAVVLAVTPEAARALVPTLPLDALTPLKMACLTLGLSKLPVPGRNFALGIDQPLYLSVHSAVAKVAPEGCHLVYLGKYLPAGEQTDPAADEKELEGLMDLMHPGWREVTAFRQYLPAMTVVGAMPDVRTGGLAGRPEVESGTPGLYLAGDWVGEEGTLASTSAASGRKAAMLALQQLERLASPALATV